MNIAREKIELIKCLADINNKAVLKKIRSILIPGERPKMVKKLREAKAEIKAGKGAKIDLKNLWK